MNLIYKKFLLLSLACSGSHAALLDKCAHVFPHDKKKKISFRPQKGYKFGCYAL